MLRATGALEADADALALGHDVGHPRGQADLAQQRPVDGLPNLHQIAVGARHQLRSSLDHVHCAAKTGIHRGHLETDNAAADHQQSRRNVLERQRGGGIKDAWVVRRARQANGARAGGDDGFVEGEDGRCASLGTAALACTSRPAVGGAHRQFVWRNKARRAVHQRDFARRGHRRQTTGQPAHHRMAVGAQRIEVDAGLAKVDAGARQMRRLAHHPRLVQQGLRRDAADIEADAAKRRVALDEGHAQAEVGRSKRCRIATRPGADDDEVVALRTGRTHSSARRRSARYPASVLLKRAAAAPSKAR